MGFWDNVVNELDYLGMTNKSLAEKAGFDASNIARGIRFKSNPSVETAVKIAEILNVSVEYLVTGKNSKSTEQQNSVNINKFKKYAQTIEKLESIPEKSRNSILSLIENVSADCK